MPTMPGRIKFLFAVALFVFCGVFVTASLAATFNVTNTGDNGGMNPAPAAGALGRADVGSFSMSLGAPRPGSARQRIDRRTTPTVRQHDPR